VISCIPSLQSVSIERRTHSFRQFFDVLSFGSFFTAKKRFTKEKVAAKD